MFRQNGENHLKMSISPDSNPKIGASCSDMFTTCCSCHSISRQMSRNVEDTDQPRLQANVEKNVATCLPRASEHPEQPTAFGNAPAGVIHWRSTNAPCFEGMHGNTTARTDADRPTGMQPRARRHFVPVFDRFKPFRGLLCRLCD